MEKVSNEILELYKKVLTHLYQGILQNQRDIDIPVGTTIVLGFFERVGKNEPNSYTIMGEYQYGDMHNEVILNNVLILDNCDNGIVRNELRRFKESYTQTAEWWRVPSDNEMRLYREMFPHLDLIDNIDKTIREIEDNDFENCDVINLLTNLRSFIQENNGAQ
jgi:hypothetical protein